MRRAITGLILVLVAVLLAACGGLAGEPEIVGQIPAEQRASQNVEVVAPNIEPNLMLGAQIFAENCVRCHGITGAGDGEFALSGQVKDLPDFTDPAQHEGKTGQDYYRQVTLGNIEKLMPPFSGSLSDEERWAVANFVFTLLDGASSDRVVHSSSDNSTTTEENTATTTETTVDEPVNEAAGIVSGTVTLATEGSILPEGLVATLHIFDLAMSEQSFETTVTADNSYQFNKVAIDADHGYYVSVKYGEGVFNSDFLKGNPDSNMALDVTVYDVTDDTAVLQLTRVLTQVDLLPDNTLRIWQMYSWVNTSDKLFATGSGTGHQLSVRVPVPANATLSSENDMTRYLYDSESGYVYDTYPLLPGEEHSFYLQYTAPFSGSLELDQQFDYTLTGVYQVYADESVFNLKADGWSEIQTQEFQGATYTGLGTIGDEHPLTISLSSKGFSFNFDKQTMGMILTVVGIVFMGVAAFLFMRGSKSSEVALDPSARVQALMKEIANLDDRYQAQKISESSYKSKREKLKGQLAALMKAQE
jgi:mono/diheme cytochrome c family protein